MHIMLLNICDLKWSPLIQRTNRKMKFYDDEVSEQALLFSFFFLGPPALHINWHIS
jgi:hypothetical protein